MFRLSPKKALSISVLFISTILLLCGSYFRLFDNNELDTLDLRFRLRRNIPASDKVVIIEIGDDTIKQLGRFPFDRRYHALLVRALTEYGAKAVMFDIFFSEPDKSDAEFKEAIKQAKNVYLPYVFDMGYQHKEAVPEAGGYSAENLEDLTKEAKGIGHINVIPDPDGKFRRVPLFIKYKGVLKPSLSLGLVCDYLGILPKDIRFRPAKFIQCGANINIPLDDDSNAIINYAGSWGRFYRHYSYVDLLRSFVPQQSGKPPILDLNVVRDKICLIGLTATGTTDLHPSPFSSLYPALGIHADIINSVIQGRFISRAPKAANLAVLFILLALGLWVVCNTMPLKGFWVFAGLVTLYAAICIFVFVIWGLWLDMFYPIFALGVMYLGCLLGMYIREFKKRLLLENELQIARKIQESFLPKSPPSSEGIEIAAAMYTAKEVGGDLYDFYEFGPEKLAVLIGDVTGKGIPASLFMSKVSGAFKFFASPDKHPAETLSDLNMKLTRESSTATFMTVFYCLLDTQKKVMTFASGGHPPVLYLAKNSSPKFLDVEEGLPLGMMEAAYSGNQVSYSGGDIFVFYTDGVTEARDGHGKMYGPDRLVSVAERNKGCSCQDLLKAIAEDVRRFEPKARQHDDLTLIVIRAI